MSMQKIKKEPKVSAPNVNVSPGVQLDAALTSIGTQIDLKADIAAVDAVTGSRSNLNTTDKTNLVAAINELNNKVNTDNDYNNLTNKPIEKTSDNGYRITGSQTVASAANAFAEGNESKATAASAHAEGTQTEATQTSAHAEGQGSWAWGVSSHAEGQETWACGYASHAEGYTSVAYGLGSHAEGRSEWMNIGISRAYTAGDRTMYVKAEVEPGHVITDDVQIVGVLSCTYQEQEQDYSLILDSSFSADFAAGEILAESCSAYGAYSHTEGNLTTAKGAASHAEGGGTNANGSSSHAEGEESVADGAYAHTEGYYTYAQNDAEHASGKYNKSTYNVTIFSVGIGTADNARVNAFEIDVNGKVYVKGVGGYDGTNIEGQNVKALGESGWLTINYADITGAPIRVEGDYINHSWALGRGVIGTEEYYNISDAFAVGRNAQALEDYAFATGYNTVASGTASFVSGKETTATGIYSHAEGYNTNALGESSHAEGESNNASGKYSHAEGRNSEALGEGSHAEGGNTTASAKHSHAEGYYTNALGVNSHAEGLYTQTRNANEHAEGKYNLSTPNVTLSSVGCGHEVPYSPDVRMNAFEIDVNGNVYIKGIGGYDGTNITGTGVKSVQEVIADLTQQIAALTNNQ